VCSCSTERGRQRLLEDAWGLKKEASSGEGNGDGDGNDGKCGNKVKGECDDDDSDVTAEALAIESVLASSKGGFVKRGKGEYEEDEEEEESDEDEDADVDEEDDPEKRREKEEESFRRRGERLQALADVGDYLTSLDVPEQLPSLPALSTSCAPTVPDKDAYSEANEHAVAAWLSEAGQLPWITAGASSSEREQEWEKELQTTTNRCRSVT
jgi:hypothetical protein